ncbi:DUF1272 domain-containing protein [Sphingomonas sp. PAMC 26621]|uniref:DUF1272 domain-containing protein n=1 Tax=Sphingomonas sp. PAMC 26621 TaxID=1112213 RepID=UPI0002885595
MLELRPNCELCDADLPPDSPAARICTYECTYCARCVEDVFGDVCPTCGGNFMPRPIRPQQTWRKDLNLGLRFHPASRERRRNAWTDEQIAELTQRLRGVAPDRR